MISFIPAKCILTNEPVMKKVTWPQVFAALPRKGDFVIGTFESGEEIVKEVTSVMHTITIGRDKAMNREYQTPSIVVYLK